MAEHDEGDLLVQSATGEGDDGMPSGEQLVQSMTGDPDDMFWGSEVVPASYLHNKLSQAGWEGLIMVLVDAMFLHKVAFEATEASLVSNSLNSLNNLARGLFEDFSNHELPAVISPRGMQDPEELEEVDKHVPRWCKLLLCATKASPIPDTERKLSKLSTRSVQRGAGYPFSNVDGARVESLERLKMVWKDAMFITMFPQLLERLGPNRRRKLLCSMCVEVPQDILRGRHRHFYDWSSPVKLARGNWNGQWFDSQGVILGQIPPPEDLAAVNPKEPRIWSVWLRSNSYRSTVAVYYTEVPHVFYECGADTSTFRSLVSQLHIVRCNMAVLAASDDWQEYTIPFAQALAKHQWNLAWPFFVCKFLLDVVFQILVNSLLLPVSHQFDDSVVVTSLKEQRVQLYATLLLGSYGFFLNLAELFSLLSMYHAGDWARVTVVHMNAYRTFMVSLDTFTLWLMGRIGWDYMWCPAKTDESILVTFPSTMVFLVFFKWCQTLLQSMNISVFLGTLLPAWKAVTEEKSLSLLLMLGVLTCGTAMAYYASPLDNMAEGSWGGVHWEAITESFFRLARLNFMGDIDHDEFLGSADSSTSQARLLNARISNKKRVASNAENMSRYHWPLACFMLFCGIIFPVSALNLYVGVLSHAYDNAVNSLLHSEGVLHSTTAARYLLAFKAWSRCFSWSAWGSERSTSAGQEHEQPGTWIGIAGHRATAPGGIEIDGLDLKDTLTLIKVNMDEDKLEFQEHRLEVEQRVDKLEKALAALGDQMDYGGGRVDKSESSTTPGPAAGASSDLQAVMNRLERMEKSVNNRLDSLCEGVNKLKEASR